MRDEELNMTSAPGKLKLTFAELFERRLKTMPGKKTKIQITVLAEVRYTIGSTSELESKEWGPFHNSIPKLTKSDMYKLFIYILLTNGFSILSNQTIEEVGAKIITVISELNLSSTASSKEHRVFHTIYFNRHKAKI